MEVQRAQQAAEQLRGNLQNTQADVETILIPTFLQGAAMAFFFIPLQAIVFSGLTPDQLPAASGLSNFARITAGAPRVWSTWGCVRYTASSRPPRSPRRAKKACR